jgi:hypothetical protein
MVDRTSNLSGLRVPSSELYSNQSGLSSISPGLDGAARRQQALDRIAGFGAEAAPQLRPPPGAAPQASAVPQASSGAYYNPSLDRFSVGGVEFGREDYDIALQASSLAGQPAPPPTTPGYRPISTTMLGDYLSTISEGRGVLGNLGIGTQQAVGSVLTGLGRGAQMAGFEGTAEALVGAGEVVGPSSAEQARSAAIYSRQTPLQRLGTGVVQAVPSLLTSVLPGVGAAGLAVRAGATAGGLAARGAAAAGAATTVLPMHIDGSWRAAEANPNLDTSDPEIQTEILMSALGKTAIDLLGQDFAIRGLSAGLRGIISDKAKRGGRLKRALGAGAAEGTAELLTEVVDQVVFDADSRAALSEDDWAALWPIITQKYGEQNLLSFGVGAVLGGGLGALSPGPAAAPNAAPTGTPAPIRNVSTGAPTDLLSGTVLEPKPASPEEIAAQQAQLDAMGVPTVQPGATPSMETGAGLNTAGLPVLSGADTGPLGPRVGELSPEDQALASSWASQVLPPAAPVQPIAVQRTDLPPGMAQPRPRTRPTPPDFVAGTEPVQPIAAQRTDLPPGMQRLRQRPSERAETYASTPAPAGETAMAAQLAQLQQAAMQPAPVVEAPVEVPVEVPVEPAPTGEITPREYDAAYGGWEEIRADQSNPDALPSLPRLNKKAQREWATAVRAGTADAALFGRLAKRKVSKAEPLVATGVTATREADINAMQQQVAAARATEAAQQDLQGQAAALRALGQRMERARPPLPANTYGTAEGAPFRNKAQANAPANRKRVAEQITEETDQAVTAKDLEPVEVAGGWALRVKTPPTPPAPKPTLKRGKPDAVREQGAKESTLRQGPKAGGKVRGRDTQGQAAAGEGTQETAQEDTAQEQPTVREAEVTPPPAKPAKPKKVKLPAEETDAELDQSAAMEAVIEAEDVILNDARKKRTLLTQAELDAGVELTVLSTNSDPAVASAALDVLELNLSATQYKELAAYVERANNHGSLGGNRADADFAGKELQTMVTMFNSGAVPDNSVAAFEARFRELAARVRKSDPKAAVLGYATVNNSPNKKAGQIAHTTPNTKPGGAFSLASLADVVLGNGKRAVPLAIGKQRMIARNILNKFKVKPELSVFASQADMKQRNPALYKRAAAARSQGDFDSAPAVGYFFDNQVIIFSDRVATRQQLEFVVAHEVLGHFGMRSVLGASEFNTLMDSVYTGSSPYTKVAIDDMVAARGMPRAEAVEEYLSDFAAQVETSVLRRWWAKVKDALNKIGFKFDDDVARYLMNQSRRYLRTGEKGSVFNTDRVAGTMHQLEAGTDPTGVGRFSTAAEQAPIRELGHMVDDPGRVMPSSIQDAQDKFTRAAEVLGFAPKDLANKWDSLKRNIATPTIFRAMRNEGFQKVFDILRDRHNFARAMVTQMQERRDIALNPRVEALAGIGMGGNGISVDGRAKAGYVLKANRMFHSYRAKPLTAGNTPKLFLREPGTGKLRPVEATFDKLLKENRLSREAWAKGVRVPYDTQLTMTDAKRAELEAERDAAVAAATTDKAKNRITRDYKARIEANTYTGVKYLDVKQEFTDLEWGAFNQELDAMAHTARDVLESILTKYDQEVSYSYRRLEKQLSAAMTDGDRALMDRAVRRYVEIQDADLATFEDGQIDPSTRNTAAAEKFLAQFNAALLGTGRDRIYGLFAPNADNGGVVAFPESERQALTDMIDGLRTRYNPPAKDEGATATEARRVVQREVQLIAQQLTVTQDAEKAAVRTIQTAYVPIVREGEYQTSVVFTGVDGNQYTLGDSYREQAPYMQFAKQSDADRAAAEITELFGDTEHTVEVWDPEADNGRGKLVMKKGKLTAVSGTVLDAPTTDPEISHDAALRFIRRFGIPLTPQKLDQIITASTTSGNRAILRQLKAGFTPGAPNDLTSAISSHIESRASTVARNKTGVELENALDIKGDAKDMWFGSKKTYDALKAEYEQLKAAPNPNDDAISVARQKFEQYHRWYVAENAPANANKFYKEARTAVAFLDQQKGVLETDLANNKHIASVQMMTSVSYLGFMVASGALNIASVFTNVPAALGTVNHKTGFGGGFGLMRATTELARMTKVAAGLGGQKDTAEYWKGLTAAELKDMGIESETRDFIALGIESGIFQAAQTNSLIGSARGRVTSGGAQKFLTTYMAPFNWTEQVGRRAAGLAGFELMFQRQLAAGKSREEAAEAAAKFSVEIVSTTLGDYTSVNRPALFRGGVLQFTFMFKMFTVNTAALVANLPPAGQAALLGSLLLLSGLRGVPYAEDIEDLVNTLAQKFGIPMPSVRDSIRRSGDELIPGFGEALVSGALNRIVPFDVGVRFSAGDIIPGTGIGLAGADVSRELIEIGGPMASWIQQMVGTAGNAADILPGGKAFSLESTLRESPVSFLRAATDAYAFEKHGAIVDKRGYVVSEDYNSAVGIGRILGLYPGPAAQAYESIREAKLITEYQKSMSVYYRDRIVAATVAGDNAKVQALYAEVRDWNESAEGTGLEVVNLRSRVRSALRSQRLGATERFLKTTPLATRSAAQRIVDAYIAE